MSQLQNTSTFRFHVVRQTVSCRCRSHDGQSHRVCRTQGQPQLLLCVTERHTKQKMLSDYLLNVECYWGWVAGLWISDLKENLKSCCCAVWLAESGRSSVEMFCRVSSLGESCTFSSTQRSVKIYKKNNWKSIIHMRKCSINTFSHFSYLLHHHRTLQLRHHHWGWASWCSCTYLGYLQLLVLGSSAWAMVHLTNKRLSNQSCHGGLVSANQEWNQTRTDLEGHAPGPFHLSPVCLFS